LAKNPIEKFIDSLPFFKEFSAAEREKVVQTSGVFEKYKAGKVILSEGEKTAAVFVILKGTIAIQKKVKVDVTENHIPPQKQVDLTIKELKAGSIFGEISLISQRPRNSSAIASSDQVVVMKITEELIEKFNFSIQRKIQNQLVQILVERLEDMNEQFIKFKTSILKP
jgi:CRP/FNR family transcriptional regulator, cyclic AMP receptor protein